MASRTLTDPPQPGTQEWMGVITASKVPAILGVSRFKSQYSMWHEMAGLAEPEMMDEDRADWGHIAERSLASWWQHKNPGWKLNPKRNGTYEIAYTNEALPFPNTATLDRRATRGRAHHIVECKTAMTLKDWGRPGEPDSVPTDYYAQIQFQMGVSGIHQASAVVLGPYASPEIHDIEFNQDEFDGIVQACKLWQASLDMGVPPALDSSLSTYETLRGLHPDIDPGQEVQLNESDASLLVKSALAVDEAQARFNQLRNEAMAKMGDAKWLKHGDTKIGDRRARGNSKPYLQINKKVTL